MEVSLNGSSTSVRDSAKVREPWPDGAWQEQMQSRILTPETALEEIGCSKERLPVTIPEDFRYPFTITPHVLQRLKEVHDEGAEGDFEALCRIYFPSSAEKTPKREEITGTGEELTGALENVYRFFSDRILIRLTSFCPVMCRYCFVRKKVGPTGSALSEEHLQRIGEYLRDNPEIRDVIISGGDPLLFGDDRLASLLTMLEEIPSIKMVRFDTKVPNVLPQRVTGGLIDTLSGVQLPVYINVHFSHAAEINGSVFRSSSLLRSAGCILGAHIPLLNEVNDSADGMVKLVQRLLETGIRPYMLIQYIPTDGADHFGTSIEKGRRIIQSIWGRVSGMGIPIYVCYLPEGNGKSLLMPDGIVDTDGDQIVVTNHRGKEIRL